jgi:hypothetical protein
VPCELENCHSEESNQWAEVQAFFYAQLHATTLILPHNNHNNNNNNNNNNI